MLELQERPDALAANRQRMEAQLSVLEDRARFLPPGDKILVSLYLRGELRNRQMAELLKLNPSTLCRRVRGWVKRLNDPIVAALIERPAGLSDEHREIALRYFLLKQPRRHLAKEFARTPFEISQIIAYVHGWCGAVRATARQGTRVSTTNGHE